MHKYRAYCKRPHTHTHYIPLCIGYARINIREILSCLEFQQKGWPAPVYDGIGIRRWGSSRWITAEIYIYIILLYRRVFVCYVYFFPEAFSFVCRTPSYAHTHYVRV